jgi:predicted metal-binding membrane protein
MVSEPAFLGAAASFLGMWVVMMMPMMLPSLVPMLRRYRHAVQRTAKPPLGRLTAVVALGYVAVWTAVGVLAFPLGVAMETVGTHVPLVVGTVVLTAGALQFSAWKARHLACCRRSTDAGTLPADVRTALRHGLRLGLHCSCCCAGLTAILLVLGMMDLRAMAVVTAAITFERLAPGGERVARAIGYIAVAGSLCLLAQAVASDSAKPGCVLASLVGPFTCDRGTDALYPGTASQCRRSGRDCPLGTNHRGTHERESAVTRPAGAGH